MAFVLFRRDMDAFVITTIACRWKGSIGYMSGIASCPSNPEGREGKSALSDKVSGPLLTRACGAT